MNRLATTLRDEQGDAAKIEAAIVANLREVGYGG
jgi:hypothetical protein